MLQNFSAATGRQQVWLFIWCCWKPSTEHAQPPTAIPGPPNVVVKARSTWQYKHAVYHDLEVHPASANLPPYLMTAPQKSSPKRLQCGGWCNSIESCNIQPRRLRHQSQFFVGRPGAAWCFACKDYICIGVVYNDIKCRISFSLALLPIISSSFCLQSET